MAAMPGLSLSRLLPARLRPAVVPVLRLSGMIAAGPRPGTLSDATFAPLIEHAFRGRPAAVALVINSPGGSAVQSSLIAARIRRLADAKKVPVHAFVEDVAASGGYWLAAAADDIWVDAASVVGSIGVISAGFGFADLIARHGIERRVHTAGRSKSFLDPFRPERDEDIARLRALIGPMHAVFIAHVRARRGARLDARLDAGCELFTGDVWLGAEAVAAGLADGVAHAVPKLRELYGERVRLRPLAPRRPLLARFGLALGGAAGGAAGAGLVAAVADEAEERARRARLGGC